MTTACACNAQPCECNPAQTVSAADIALLAQDIKTINNVVESPQLTTITPGGREIDTLTGAITKLGFQPPIAYAAGIEFTTNDTTKTIDRNGIVYAPLPSAIPFTTSGTWDGDDALKFYTVQSVHLYDGDVVISKPTVADMSGDANLQLGNVVRTQGYLAPFDLGANWYKIVPAGTGPADGGTFIDLAASGFQAQTISDSDRVNVAQYGAVGNGTVDDSVPVQNAANAVGLYGGGELEFPLTGGGMYLCNFILPPGVSIRGASRSVTLKPATNSPVITAKTDANVARASIKEITIDGTDNQGSFTAQDGIRIAPAATFKHESLTIEDCRIVNCGASGVALFGVDQTVVDQVSLVSINRCEIEDNTGPGIDWQGNVDSPLVTGSLIANNGDGTDLAPNILVQSAGPGDVAPSNVAIFQNRIITESYVGSGVALGLFGALDPAIRDNFFGEFHTAIKIDQGPNGVVQLIGNRFNRSSGPITALVDVLDVNGFIYESNNVTATTTGPIGLKLPTSSANCKRYSIGETNSYGALTKASESLPATAIGVAATSINMPVVNGPVRISLDADGTAPLDTLNDFNGGVQQLSDGDTVVLSITNVLRKFSLAETGNVLLAGGVPYTCNAIGDNIALAWSVELQKFVERWRVNLS